MAPPSSGLQQPLLDLPEGSTPDRFDGKTPDAKKSILEARGLTWTDDYFIESCAEEEASLVAVFDFDNELKFQYWISLHYGTHIVLLVVGTLYLWAASMSKHWFWYVKWIPLALYCITATPYWTPKQVRWMVESEHVAITIHGIRHVRARRKSCWGHALCDIGKHAKTVPFEMITDCNIIESNGMSRLIIPKVITTINIDTASSGNNHSGIHIPELKIVGLKDPEGFKKLVLAMKLRQRQNSHHPNLSTGAAPLHSMTSHSRDVEGMCSMELVQRKATAAAVSSVLEEGNQEVVTSLLRELRDEMRTNNALLRESFGRDRDAGRKEV